MDDLEGKSEDRYFSDVAQCESFAFCGMYTKVMRLIAKWAKGTLGVLVHHRVCILGNGICKALLNPKG